MESFLISVEKIKAYAEEWGLKLSDAQTIQSYVAYYADEMGDGSKLVERRFKYFITAPSAILEAVRDVAAKQQKDIEFMLDRVEKITGKGVTVRDAVNKLAESDAGTTEFSVLAQILAGVYDRYSGFYDFSEFTSRCNKETVRKVQTEPDGWILAVYEIMEI